MFLILATGRASRSPAETRASWLQPTSYRVRALAEVQTNWFNTDLLENKKLNGIKIEQSSIKAPSVLGQAPPDNKCG